MFAIQRFTAVGAIDNAFLLYRTHFKVLFVISLIVNVPNALANLAFAYVQFELESGALSLAEEGGFANPDELAELAPAFALWAAVFAGTLLVSVVTAMFGLAAATRVASDAALGREPALESALGSAFKAFWPLLGASLLTSLAASIGAMFFLVPGVYIYLGFALVGPAVVLEGAGVTRAMERSWSLSNGRKVKILAAMMLVFAIVGVASMGLAMLVSLVPELDRSLTAQLVATSLTQLVAALGTPVWWVALVLLYYDGRVELEAFDIEMLAQSTPPPSQAAGGVGPGRGPGPGIYGGQT